MGSCLGSLGWAGLFIQTPGALALNNCYYFWISKFCLSFKIEDLSVQLPSQFILVSHTFIELLLGCRYSAKCQTENRSSTETDLIANQLYDSGSVTCPPGIPFPCL